MPLVVEALHRALDQRHVDQSSQYRASDHCTLLSEHGISCCISAKGCCWGNAVVERFFSTLTLELDLYEIKTL